MKKPFDKIKLSQLHLLCNILADSGVRSLSNIRRKYLERALAFDETLYLLEDLKIVRNDFEELIPSKPFSLAVDSLDKFKIKFLPVLFSAIGDVSDELRTFLLNFQTENDKIFFKATELEKVKFSDTRNLLLELEFISAGEDNSTYFVNPRFTDLFVKQFGKWKLSPGALKKKQAENESIGFAAEKKVIEFELKRLTEISVLPSEIEHTSQENVLAGYDIKSFENYLDSNFERINRFIEVKAVSVADYRFYWSKNEMDIAKVFGEKYYLYLLPVKPNNILDVSNLEIICNPAKTIRLSEHLWGMEAECLAFFKK